MAGNLEGGVLEVVSAMVARIVVQRSTCVGNAHQSMRCYLTKPSWAGRQGRERSPGKSPFARFGPRPLVEPGRSLLSPTQRPLAPERMVQPKLRIGQPGDVYEREADRVAEEVFQKKPSPCACGGSCPACQGKKKVEVQRQVEPGRGEAAASVADDFVQNLGPGRPLDPTARAFFEPRFGHDFSQVRIHHDSEAAQAANLVHARAFTLGNDVVFNAGEYSPADIQGQVLLAHELVHVLQQAGREPSASARLQIVPAHSPSEREADALADRIVNGLPRQQHAISAQAQTGTRLTIQRKPRFSADCNEYKRCEVIEPLAAANQMLDTVLAELQPIADGSVTRGRVFDLVNVHFHNPSNTAVRAGMVLDYYRAIKRELNTSLLFVCPPKDPATCKAKDGLVGAFTTCSAGSDITLCNVYNFLSCIDQAGILIHETAHHLGFCTDFAYVHEAGKYMALPAHKATRNPDTYAQFAKMVFLGTPSCKNCSTEVQLQPGQY